MSFFLTSRVYPIEVFEDRIRSVQPLQSSIFLNSLAKQRPDDLNYQLAVVDHFGDQPAIAGKQMTEVISHMTQLLQRFPNSPAIIAAIVGRSSQGNLLEIRPQYSKEVNRSFNHEPPIDLPEEVRIRRQFHIANVLKYSEMGIRIDPENAYFHLARAAALFGISEDTLALTEFSNAAKCTIYDDYIGALNDGEYRLINTIYPHTSVLNAAASTSSIVYGHYALFSKACDIALFIAKECERLGVVENGIRIRRDILKIGALLRDKSTTYYGVVVGSRICWKSVLINRPLVLVPDQILNTSEERLARNEVRLAEFLRRTGHSDLTAEFKNQFDQCRKSETFIRNLRADLPISSIAANVLPYWYLGTALLLAIGMATVIILLFMLSSALVNKLSPTKRWVHPLITWSLFVICATASSLCIALDGINPLDLLKSDEYAHSVGEHLMQSLTGDVSIFFKHGVINLAGGFVCATFVFVLVRTIIGPRGLPVSQRLVAHSGRAFSTILIALTVLYVGIVFRTNQVEPECINQLHKASINELKYVAERNHLIWPVGQEISK